MRLLVTGTAGFIGYHVAERLLERGDEVVGLDVVNDYYDVSLKEARLARLARHPGYRHERVDLADGTAVERVFAEASPARVIHLAAQAGVRYSLTNPGAYVQSNLVGFAHVLEGCRHHGVEHLTYASSSSVYGANTAMPFSVRQTVDHPLSLYAASKKANEAMAHTYAHLYGLPTTGLRFFTVYGPWGRPDMAMFIFARKILAGEPIDVFNHGRMRRDFTYIDDVAEGVVRVSDRPAAPNPAWSGDAPDPSSSRAPWRIYNIGNHTPVELMELIGLLERELGRDAVKNYLPMQPGDVPATYADVEELTRDVGFTPGTPIEEGVRRFVAWYREYFGDRPRVRGASSSGSARPESCQDRQDGAPHDHQVQAEGAVLHVVEVVAQLGAGLDRARRVPVSNLRPARDARSNVVPKLVQGDLVIELVGEHQLLRPGSDDAHFTPQHVPELRQLVQSVLPKEGTYWGDARVAIQREGTTVLLGVRDHRAELDHSECPTSEADAVLEEQDGATRVAPHHERHDARDREQQRRGQHDAQDIEGPLPELVTGAAVEHLERPPPVQHLGGHAPGERLE
jgi:UDP-glucuronate 4-epimerase